LTHLFDIEVMHVVGARPNMPKAAPVIRALSARGVRQQVVNTGQHYHDAMSAAMMSAVGMPTPDIDLAVGSGSHALQTAAILSAIEPVLVQHRPALVIVYGDVNSTLATALAAVKLHIPVAHVEAGLRSHDTTMPEEINRRLVDHMCNLLLVTSPDAWPNLRAEGLADERVVEVGNPMIDSVVRAQQVGDFAARRTALGLTGDFALATIHRPSNVDDPAAAAAMLAVLRDIAMRLPVVLPLHPRSQRALTTARELPGVRVVEPLAYSDFLAALEGARLVLTDSGGVQEESSYLGVPCVTVRTTTERPVTITHGTNRLATAQSAVGEVDVILGSARPVAANIALWDGHAGERIADAITHWLLTVPSRGDGVEARDG
jgi:UDP-N-acetylglucosamine 2-epimerase (non-hydrolysing)